VWVTVEVCVGEMGRGMMDVGMVTEVLVVEMGLKKVMLGFVEVSAGWRLGFDRGEGGSDGRGL
jgi:hypothetical protein